MSANTRRVVFDDQSASLDRFGLLLGLTIASIVCLSLVDLDISPRQWLGETMAGAASALVGVSLLLALRASGLARRWQRVVDVAVLAGIAALALELILSAVTGRETANISVVAPVFIVMVAITTPTFVVRRLLRHRRVSMQTLVGAVSVYLLIPVAFFYLYLSLDQYLEPNLFGRAEPTTSFMYFSLVTLTTVGFGDLTPVTNLGRLAASAESVVGQLYLVTFVAMLVGLVARRWQPGGAADTDDAG